MSRDRDFDRWVRERLSSWPTEQILELERWLLDEEQFEFVPAVREAWRQRSVEPDPRESSVSLLDPAYVTGSRPQADEAA
jgi:hypothetical protein